MDIRELRVEDRISHNGDIGEVVEIKTNHVRLIFLMALYMTGYVTNAVLSWLLN